MLYPNFEPFPHLTTDRLILRKLEIEDAPEVFVQRSDPTINKFIKRESAKNIEEAKEWILKVLNNEKNNESITWVICLKGETKSIGTICLWNIERVLDKAEVGYSLHFNYFGKGLMNEALMKVVNYGFEEMKLKRIDAYTNKDNTASLKLLQKNKFFRNLEFENDYENKDELEYNTIHTRLHSSKF
ncbi:GNAT family N-acetyltransferase [Aurantibacillus circumpalustris]|uniref:GNAT family N-acetyltransferase n=1 Tax=Aurantibacillus circumpalustris TaxID=3036359 RepID=UPI00295BFD08|nr:GNAT family N-acetyltransferase [Aurantibacillus circumpalustris]